MEGPIARYSETAESLYEGHKITFKNICFGSQRILWGILKKFIIADRLNVVVKACHKPFKDHTAKSATLPTIIGPK